MARSEYQRLTVIIDDLKRIEKECGTDAALGQQGAEELKTFDAFQRRKHALNLLVADLRQRTDAVDEMTRNLPEGTRDANVIKLLTDNHRTLQRALSDFKELNRQYEADAAALARGKLPNVNAKDMELRNRSLEVFRDELVQLHARNARVRGNSSLPGLPSIPKDPGPMSQSAPTADGNGKNRSVPSGGGDRVVVMLARSLSILSIWTVKDRRLRPQNKHFSNSTGRTWPIKTECWRTLKSAWTSSSTCR